MRSCPKCQTKYTDDTLEFCLQDGTQLEQEISDTPSNMETVAFNETETVVSNRQPEKMSFDFDSDEEETWEGRVLGSIPKAESKSGTPKSFLAIAATVFVMLILFGVIAGTWFYLNYQRKTEGNAEANTSNSKRTIAGTETNMSPSVDTPTPSPIVDKEKIKKDVSKQIYSWKSLAEARNLNLYMSKYGAKIDYYTKRGVSRGFVRKDKSKAFSKYTSIKSKFTKINISIRENGTKAIAVFDKEWDFSNSQKRTTGKVRSRLVFRKIKGKWLIVSERDLKVYYVNK